MLPFGILKADIEFVKAAEVVRNQLQQQCGLYTI